MADEMKGVELDDEALDQVAGGAYASRGGKRESAELTSYEDCAEYKHGWCSHTGGNNYCSTCPLN